MRHLAQAGIRLPGFLGAFGLEFPDVIRELGGAAEGLLGTTAWQPGVHVPAAPAESNAFVEAYRTRFGRDPVPLSMHGYATGRALLAAVAAALAGGRAPTAEAVRTALGQVDLETPLGRIRFTREGDPVAYERVVVQVQRGSPRRRLPAGGRDRAPDPSTAVASAGRHPPSPHCAGGALG